MKKVLIAAVLFFFPLFASAKGIMMHNDLGSCGMISTSILFTHILAIIVVAIWGIVGILAAAWLWQHLDGKKHSHTHEEK